MLDFSAKRHMESAVEVMPFSKMNKAIEKVRAGKVIVCDRVSGDRRDVGSRGQSL